MKVALVQPPIQDFYDTDLRLQPIGLCYLKAAVRKHLPGVEVIVKDYHGGCGRKTAALPKELEYLSDYYPVPDKSPFSLFHQYYHFGRSFDEIETDLLAMKPDLVGISSLFTPYYREALKIAARVKKTLSVPVIMGGSHASAAADSLLCSPHVDYVVRGEGERAFVEFLRFLHGSTAIEAVPNLAYKKDGRLCFNPIEENFPLDDIPFPDLADLSPTSYAFGVRPLTFLITSRSCPHRCSFCSVHTTFGKNYRLRSIDDVLEEIELRYGQGYRVIDFEDDNLTFYKNAFKELCRRLIARFPGREVEFVAMNGVSYLSLDEELLELMFEAGFSHLNLALVSSDKTVRETTKRPHTSESYLRVVRKAFQLGFKIVSYQILGLPNESLGSMVQTLACNSRLPVLLGASPFYCTPDAPIARGLDLSQQDYLKARLTAMAVETQEFGREDIYTLFVTTRIINFLKGLRLTTSAHLADLLVRPCEDERTRIGLELLKTLGESERLFFWTKKGLVENKKFKPELFLRVLLGAGEITCQDGNKIFVGEFARSAAFPERSIKFWITPNNESHTSAEGPKGEGRADVR
ncbi:MAG: B12-binding domain-containing radical SAM protein [Deltaproteobacteria bacterium]|nr:B12-binding domain-containing radical SAM protein [Deltaproteobacteria bacterium]